jgi:hypothetical protein
VRLTAACNLGESAFVFCFVGENNTLVTVESLFIVLLGEDRTMCLLASGDVCIIIGFFRGLSFSLMSFCKYGRINKELEFVSSNSVYM